MDDDELLTSTETARLLRVHPKHLYRLLRQGLPGHRAGKGHWRFWRSEVLAWLEARGRGGTSREGSIEVSVPEGLELGNRWFVSRIGNRWIAHPVRADHGHAADALSDDNARPVTSGKVEVTAAATLTDLSANVLVAGCAPLLGMLLDRVESARERGRVHWLTANSTVALRLLADGFVHTAGIHLADGETGSDHVSLVKRALPGRAFHLVHLVRWRQGLAVARRNPKCIVSVQDLARPDLRVALREKGSGARRVLDRALADAGVNLRHMKHVATLADHRVVAQAVAFGAFDAGITVESAALEAGLHFLPIVDEAFDLVIPVDLVAEANLGPVLDALDNRLLRREVAILGPYEVCRMGHVQTVLATTISCS